RAAQQGHRGTAGGAREDDQGPPRQRHAQDEGGVAGGPGPHGGEARRGPRRLRRMPMSANENTAPSDQDVATAYHEAAHAVAALALDRPVVKVAILADRDRAGICFFGKSVYRPSEDWLEREVLIALAGLAAEARQTGEYDHDAAARDLRYARGLSIQRAGNEKQAARLERRLLSKAEHLLDRAAHWRAVERIAAALLEAGEISGRQARHLFEQSLREQE